MIESGMSDARLIILVTMTFMGCLALPGLSADIWQGIKGNLTSRKTKKICRRKKEREERLKKYWEIDIRNLK